jgi:N-acetylneuraminic acid mutarotase
LPTNTVQSIAPWVKKTPMPTWRYQFSTDVVDGKIYVIGGYEQFGDSGNTVSNAMEVYDPASDTWTEKVLPDTVRAAHASCVVDGKIYVLGGNVEDNWTNQVQAYDPATDTWIMKSPIPLVDEQGAGPGTCSTVEGKIYLLGGLFSGSKDTPQETLHIYDPATDAWSTGASLSARLFYATSSVVNGKIYVIGGCATRQDYPCGQLLDTVYEYDPAADAWTTKTPMPTARFGPASTVLDGSIYVLGGYRIIDGETQRVTTSERYDPATDTWDRSAPPLPTAQSKFGAAVVNGTVYVIGTEVYAYTP